MCNKCKAAARHIEKYPLTHEDLNLLYANEEFGLGYDKVTKVIVIGLWSGTKLWKKVTLVKLKNIKEVAKMMEDIMAWKKEVREHADEEDPS